MMICEKCAKELLSGTVICRHCGHNNVLQRIDAWREKRTQRLAVHVKTPSASPQPALTSHLKQTAKDGLLIRFPKQALPETPNTSIPSVEELPLWKQRLNARLQEIREQKAGETEPSAPLKKHHLDRDPRIESALNRIQRATYLPPTPSYQISARANTALAEDLLPAQMIAAGDLTTAEINAPTGAKPAPRPLVPLPAESDVEIFSEAPEEILSHQMESDLEFETEFSSAEAADTVVRPEEDRELPTQVEQITSLEAASLRLRLAAGVVDAEIIALSFLPLFSVFAFFGGKFEIGAMPFFALATIAICLIVLYFFLTYSLAGRTVGMALLKLHLASRTPVSEQEALPSTVTFTFKQAAARAVGGTISLLLFPLNLLCLIRNYDRLSISDYLSNTQIVRIKK